MLDERNVIAEDETSTLAFDLDALVVADVSLLSAYSAQSGSCYTYEGGEGRMSWCSCNTQTCTWAECCDGDTQIQDSPM